MTKLLHKLSYIKLYIVVVALISCGGVANMFPVIRIYYISTILFCLLLIIKNRIFLSKKLIIVLLVIWIYSFISSFVTGSSLNYYQNIVLTSLIGFLILTCFKYNYTELSNYIYMGFWIISFLGLINFILYTFLPDLFKESTNDNTGYFVYSIFYVFNYLPHQYHFLTRNQGMFWEPGVFSVMLNIHLFDILINRKQGLSKAILPVFLIISTFSTTGLIIMAIIFIYWFIFIKKAKLIYAITYGSLFVVAFIPFLIDNTKEKMDDSTQSAAMRAFDLYMGIEMVKSYPIFGVGMDPDNYLKRTKSVDIGGYDINSFDTNRGNTNTFLSIASRLGIPVLILFIIALFKQNLYNDKRIFFVILLFGLSSEPLFDLPFMFIIVLSAIVNKRVQIVNKLSPRLTA